MPTGVKILVQVCEMPSADALRRLRGKFLKDLDLTENDFYSTGALLPVTGKELTWMPESTPAWLDLNLWRAYFGEGYEREISGYIPNAQNGLKKIYRAVRSITGMMLMMKILRHLIRMNEQSI